jgi:hypothetical protein
MDGLKNFLKSHPALYVAILGMVSTLIARFAAKVGIPLTDGDALHAAVIVGLFFLGFIGYLSAHAHGARIGDGLVQAAEAGFEEAEPELEKDVAAGISGPAAPPGPPGPSGQVGGPPGTT